MEMTLRLHQAGALDTRMLEWVLQRMHAISGVTRGAMANVLAPHRNREPEHPLLCTTDLPDEIDRRLDRAERVVYNHLLKTDAVVIFTDHLDRLLVRALPEVASMQQSDRHKLVFDVMISMKHISYRGSAPAVVKYHGLFWELRPKIYEKAA